MKYECQKMFFFDWGKKKILLGVFWDFFSACQEAIKNKTTFLQVCFETKLEVTGTLKNAMKQCAGKQCKFEDKTICYKQCCGSGSAWIQFFCLEPDPELLFRCRIQLNMKEQICKNVISLWILDFVYCRTVAWNKIWQIVHSYGSTKKKCLY